MRKKKAISIIILIIFLFQSTNGFADDAAPNWKPINQLSDHVYQLGIQKKYEEAKKVISHFSTVFLKSAAEKGLTMEEMKMVIYAYEQAESALTSASMADSERQQKLLQFRLTVNAVTNKHHPLWRDTEKLVLEPLNKAIEASKAGETNQFQMHLNEFLTNYEIIRPSLAISLPEHQSERYDSYIKYLEHVRSSLGQSSQKNKQLLEIQREFQSLFQKQEKQSSAEPELLGLIYIIGSFIAITLIYVGWRKYKGERKKKQMKNFD